MRHILQALQGYQHVSPRLATREGILLMTTHPPEKASDCNEKFLSHGAIWQHWLPMKHLWVLPLKDPLCRLLGS